MRIGITLLTRPGQNIWNSGIDQNVYHLADLLTEIPFVEEVVLINTGDQDRPPCEAGPTGERFPLVSLTDVVDHIQVAIEMSGGLPAEWIARFRARAGKIVFHACGQPYSALIEPSTFDRPGFFSDPERCDEVWLLPKDLPFAPMMRALHRCPVREVPYLWSPIFLEQSIRRFEAEGLAFGYREGALSSGKIRAAIFEPNISPIKMGIIPYLICDAMERQMPGSIEHVSLLNTNHMREQQSFVQMMHNSKLYRDGKVAITQREHFASVMGSRANIVVSHQLSCLQNYLYLDALFGNYPLIHNSPIFSDAGYYYSGSDIGEGVSALQRAYESHDRDFAEYSARSRALLARLSPFDRANRDAYARRLLALSGTVGSRAA